MHWRHRKGRARLAPGLQAWYCSPGASRPGAACPGPPVPWLLARGLLAQGFSPRASRPGAARPGPPRPGLFARLLFAQGCSPWASTPAAARLGPLRPGLLARGVLARSCWLRHSSPRAVSYHGSSCLKPIREPQRNGSEYPTQPPDHGVSAEKRMGKVAEVGDTELQAATPGAMQRAQNPKKIYVYIYKPSSQLRNSRYRTEGCETQNPKHLRRPPAFTP